MTRRRTPRPDGTQTTQIADVRTAKHAASISSMRGCTASNCSRSNGSTLAVAFPSQTPRLPGISEEEASFAAASRSGSCPAPSAIAPSRPCFVARRAAAEILDDAEDDSPKMSWKRREVLICAGRGGGQRGGTSTHGLGPRRALARVWCDDGWRYLRPATRRSEQECKQGPSSIRCGGSPRKPLRSLSKLDSNQIGGLPPRTPAPHSLHMRFSRGSP